MADIWLALLGQRQSVPFVCLRRSQSWLSEQPGFGTDSIYGRARRRTALPAARPSPETRAIREHSRWELAGPPTGRRSGDAVPTAQARRPARAPQTKSQRPSIAPLVRVRVAGPKRAATLVLPERDHITEAVQRSGTYYEPDLLGAIHKRRVSGVFVDVGAHYGNHTTFFGLECGAERVVAIEPSPPAVAGLLEAVAENHLQEVVAIYPVAAHPAWRRVTVTALPWRPRRGSSVRSNSGRVGIAPTEGAGDAPAAPLDEILDGTERVGLIKVDAEGMSAETLGSGRRVISRDRPLVAAEASSEPERHALRALLSPLGYREVGRYCWTPTWLWEPRLG